MQDAFLKLWERWDRIEKIRDPGAYLFRSALNGFRMRLRRTRTAARRLIPPDGDNAEWLNDDHTLIVSP
jgi:DNA-directed RNA polymerase specialized sigma24 family protein